jgi:hypothetical protein
MERLWSPVVATGGKRWQIGPTQEGSDTRKPLPWVANACCRGSMVRRGSAVRVRQRALQKRRISALFWSRAFAGLPLCGAFGALRSLQVQSARSRASEMAIGPGGRLLHRWVHRAAWHEGVVHVRLPHVARSTDLYPPLVEPGRCRQKVRRSVVRITGTSARKASRISAQSPAPPNGPPTARFSTMPGPGRPAHRRCLHCDLLSRSVLRSVLEDRARSAASRQGDALSLPAHGVRVYRRLRDDWRASRDRVARQT